VSKIWFGAIARRRHRWNRRRKRKSDYRRIEDRRNPAGHRNRRIQEGSFALAYPLSLTCLAASVLPASGPETGEGRDLQNAIPSLALTG